MSSSRGGDRYPFLKGTASPADYKPVAGGPKPASPLRPDPATHRPRLLAQLDEIVRTANLRNPAERDPEAKREIVAVRPFDVADPLNPPQLADQSNDVRVAGTDPVSGVVLLDAAGSELKRLREKVSEYGEPKTRKKKDGSTTTSPAHLAAIGPVASIGLATEQDLAGPRLLRLLATTPSVAATSSIWFELACRGGYVNPSSWSGGSRAQIYRQLIRLGITKPPDEFETPEELVFLVRVSLQQLRELAGAVDCIFSYDLVPNELLTWLLMKDPPRQQIRSMSIQAPPASAPSVVVLDTGISTEHPLLKPAILRAVSVVPGLASPEDTDGHGTKMAGTALYPELGRALEQGWFAATHWVHSVRMIAVPGLGISSAENRPFWPKLTVSAVETAEQTDPVPDRRRAFALAITYAIDPLLPTLWAQAVDQLAHADGQGRLLCVSAGNVDPDNLFATANAYPDSLFQWKIQEPAQASNVLTVGAYTTKTTMPPEAGYEDARAVAPSGGASPHTTTGLPESPWPIKPDIVLEGGNVALTPTRVEADAETLTSLTTGHRHLTTPLGLMSMTSEATARAARMAADVWNEDASLRPETVRGLLVHAASWTDSMIRQFGSADLLSVCGYGCPDVEFARHCAANRATVIVEDALPNSVLVERAKRTPPKKASTPATETVAKRTMKLFRMPAPEDALLQDPQADVELRVTLSYFAEPSIFRTRIEHGLDLKWDMQGPQESEDEFLERINDLLRERDGSGKRIKKERKKPFPWDIGIQRRSRGTVQSDRWRGKASLLAGAKLIAVYPVLGWWDRRDDMKTKSIPFSLIVSIVAPNIYTAVQTQLPATIPIEV